jgi:hypothetical protein
MLGPVVPVEWYSPAPLQGDGLADLIVLPHGHEREERVIPDDVRVDADMSPHPDLPR